MADLQFTLDEEQIQKVLFGDRGMAVLMESVLNQVLQSEMTDHLGAAPEERTGGRCGYRNGSYERELTTRVGRLQLEVPRDREGTFSTELFERYQRSEKALVLSLMQMVVQGVSQGVSTRRVKKITDELCGRRFSKSTVSELAKGLDEQVQTWAKRPLGECPFLICDAMQVKVRRQEAVRSTTVLLAVGVTDEGQREILGLEVALGETQAAWKRLLGQLKERGLEGVEVATIDAHGGLKNALEESFPDVIWQRCQAHFRRNVLDHTPAKLKDDVHGVLDQVLKASSPQEARSAFGRAETKLEGKADAALDVLADGWEQATAVLALPPKYRRRLRTSNMIERFIEEIRRREKVVRIFPNQRSVWRLVGALCSEKHEEWSTGKRYLTMDEFYRWKASHEEGSSEPQPLPIAA
jgi:transposase-like protein